MRKFMLLGLVALLAILAFVAAETKTKDAKTSKGEKPKASPGWVIIEEDVWVPLRFEPLASLNAIRYHYRRNEEKAAANEIDKAVSWLKFAESHALPITKEKLTTAATELTTVSNDLREGKIASGAAMDGALARAAQAFGEWHYYKANEWWGQSEEKDAARDLAMAAEYLQHAANSAHYEFGPDTTKTITDFYKNGKLIDETFSFDHDTLGMHLQGIEKAVKELGDAMMKAAK